MAVIVREKKKGSGEWWVFINHKGKRRSKKVGTKKAANSVKREVEARLAKGDLGMIKENCPTMANYGKKWLDSPLQEWGDATVRNYGLNWRLHIKPSLGNKRLDEFKRLHIKNFIEELKGKDLSSSTIQGIMAVVSGIFESAIEDEIVSSNPCQNTGKYIGNRTVRDVNSLTASEVQTLLENAAKLPIELYTWYLVDVRTGLRRGEMAALEWDDIDFDNRTLEVSKSYNYETKQLGPPKTKKNRSVDLTPATVEALRALRRHQKVASISGLIFTDEKGERLKYASLLSSLKGVAPKPITIHDLRHTYATLRVAKGDNIIDVSKQLGHSKVSMTVDRYAHWMPREHKWQVDELDNLHLSAP
jgi:integrase